MPGHRKGQHIASADGMAGLALPLTVEPDPPFRDDLGREPSGFEKTGIEQPFVQPNSLAPILGAVGSEAVGGGFSAPRFVIASYQRLRSFLSRQRGLQRGCRGRSSSPAVQGEIRISAGCFAVVYRLSCPCP